MILKSQQNRIELVTKPEANRATIANALGFRASTKRMAPKPPTPDLPLTSSTVPLEVTVDADNSASLPVESNQPKAIKVEVAPIPTIELDHKSPSPKAYLAQVKQTPSPQSNNGSSPKEASSSLSSQKMPKSVLVHPTQRHSSMKGGSPHRENIKKGVQFSPETKTTSTESELNPITYDLWVNGRDTVNTGGKGEFVSPLRGGAASQNSPASGGGKVVESSFTGQPIHVTPSRPPSSPKKVINYRSGHLPNSILFAFYNRKAEKMHFKHLTIGIFLWPSIKACDKRVRGKAARKN